MVQASATGELEIQQAILRLMLDGREWSNADLKQHLRSALPWTPADLKVGERTSEYLWENRVNNSLSLSRPSSLSTKGHVERCGHGLYRITDHGKRFINDDFDFDDLIASL